MVAIRVEALWHRAKVLPPRATLLLAAPAFLAKDHNRDVAGSRLNGGGSFREVSGGREVTGGREGREGRELVPVTLLLTPLSLTVVVGDAVLLHAALAHLTLPSPATADATTIDVEPRGLFPYAGAEGWPARAPHGPLRLVLIGLSQSCRSALLTSVNC